MITISASRVIDSTGAVHMIADTTWVYVDDFGVTRYGVMGATGNTVSICELELTDVLHIEGTETVVEAIRNGAHECTDCRSVLAAQRRWTIAYRKPRANRFQRVTNWVGTWHESVEMSGVFGKLNPELQVFYVPTLESEERSAIQFGENEDYGNVLVDSGKRIRMTETGVLSDEILNAYAEKVLSDMGGMDNIAVADVVTEIIETGREDLYPVFDLIEAIQYPRDLWVTKIPTENPMCACRNDVMRCYTCVRAFAVRLFRIDLSVELPPNWIPPTWLFQRTDCE